MSIETRMAALLADNDTLNTINDKLLGGAPLTKREFYVVNSIIGMIQRRELIGAWQLAVDSRQPGGKGNM